MISFADLARLWTIAEAWVQPGEAVIAAGAEAIFCSHDPGFEGLVLGIDFAVESADLQTSPVKLVTVGAQALQGNATALGDPVQTFTAPLTRNGSGFSWPFPWGLPIRQGRAIALQWQNNEAVSLQAHGTLWGIKWTQNALAELARTGSLAGVTAVSGGPGLSSGPLQGVFCT